MKKIEMLLRFFIIIVIICPAFLANGKALLLEPYLSGGLGVSSHRFNIARHSFISIALGGRLGVDFDSLTIGVDVFQLNSFASGHAIASKAFSKDSPPTVHDGIWIGGVSFYNSAASFNPLSFGVFLASQFASSFNAYSTFFFSYKKDKWSVYQGPGIKLGLGYTPISFIKLGLEFVYSQYFCSKHCKEKTPSTYHALFSLSIPLRYRFQNEKRAFSEK